MKYTFIHIAAGYFVPVDFIDSPVSLATGFIADYTMAAVIGFAIYLLLKKTGIDYAVIKGVAFGAFIYLICYGAFMALDITRASLLTPLPNLLLFFPHIVFGGFTAWIIKRYSILGKTNNT